MKCKLVYLCKLIEIQLNTVSSFFTIQWHKNKITLLQLTIKNIIKHEINT